MFIKVFTNSALVVKAIAILFAFSNFATAVPASSSMTHGVCSFHLLQRDGCDLYGRRYSTLEVPYIRDGSGKDQWAFDDHRTQVSGLMSTNGFKFLVQGLEDNVGIEPTGSDFFDLHMSYPNGCVWQTATDHGWTTCGHCEIGTWTTNTPKCDKVKHERTRDMDCFFLC